MSYKDGKILLYIMITYVTKKSIINFILRQKNTTFLKIKCIMKKLEKNKASPIGRFVHFFPAHK